MTAVGDRFVVHMDREALNDYPMGRYDVTVIITTFDPDREIAWTIEGVIDPPIGHVYGYKLEPGGGRDARDVVLRLVDDRRRAGRKPTSSRSFPSPRCGRPSASSPARSRHAGRRPGPPERGMAGLAVGIVGAGGVGVATASALIMRGLAGRVTVYTRDAGAAHGLALDFMHARPLLPQIEVRGRGLDEIEREDILIITAGHHTTPGETPPRHPAPEHRRDGRRRDGGRVG